MSSLDTFSNELGALAEILSSSASTAKIHGNRRTGIRLYSRWSLKAKTFPFALMDVEWPSSHLRVISVLSTKGNTTIRSYCENLFESKCGKANCGRLRVKARTNLSNRLESLLKSPVHLPKISRNGSADDWIAHDSNVESLQFWSKKPMMNSG